MAPQENGIKKKAIKNSDETTANSRILQEYIQALQTQLVEEHQEKEALSLERAKLKVCWEMTLEELASTRTELMEKIQYLERELEKQHKRRKILQSLLEEYGKNMEQMKGLIDSILIERPKCNIKY